MDAARQGAACSWRRICAALIEQGELELHYQPTVSLDDDRVAGVRGAGALARIRERGMVIARPSSSRWPRRPG